MCNIGRIKKVAKEDAPVIFDSLTGTFRQIGEKIVMQPIIIKEKIAVRVKR